MRRGGPNRQHAGFVSSLSRLLPALPFRSEAGLHPNTPDQLRAPVRRAEGAVDRRCRPPIGELTHHLRVDRGALREVVFQYPGDLVRMIAANSAMEGRFGVHQDLVYIRADSSRPYARRGRRTSNAVPVWSERASIDP